jgi:thiamine biosynthesis lipoprotein
MTAQPALTTHAEPVMGTVFSLTAVHGDLPPDAVRAALAAACRVLHHCDTLFSTWDPASPVSRFRRGEAALGQMPPEFTEVLRECRAAKEASGGWFDPWALPGGFDPTGLVKGWATERALEELRCAGLPGALINGGGDVAVFGSPADGHRWRVGIRHPWRADALACVIEAGQGPVTEERGLEPSGGSRGVAPPGQQGNALAGTLTVRGTTRPITLTVTDCEMSRGSFTARATARIDRTEFGITAARGLAARYLDLTVEVQCTRN